MTSRKHPRATNERARNRAACGSFGLAGGECRRSPGYGPMDVDVLTSFHLGKWALSLEEQ